MTKYVLSLAAILFTYSLAFAGPSQSPDALSIDANCKAEAVTAGCGSDQVGTGLRICIHKYKKANKDFKLSEGCRDAMKKMRQDHKKD